MKKPLLLLVSILAVLATPTTALAGAGNKKPQYSSEAQSRAGLCDFLGLGVSVACAESSSTTNNAGAESQATSTPLVVPIAECMATGVDKSGAEKEQQASGIDLGFAQLLTGSCKAKAVQQNNADSQADSEVAQVKAGGASLDVARSHADNKTTSGNARSSAEFTAVDLDTQAVDAQVIDCSSSSTATKQNSETTTEGELVEVDGTTVDDPGVCSVLVESEASHSSGNP